MKKLGVIVAITVGIGAIVAISPGCSRFHEPPIEATTNKDRDWHIKYLKTRVSSLQPRDGQVEITGQVFDSPDVQTRTVPVGHKIEFPDDHGHWTYTIAKVQNDGVVIEYESSFDHRSFGKNLISRDSGSFKLAWFTAATTASATQASP